MSLPGNRRRERFSDDWMRVPDVPRPGVSGTPETVILAWRIKGFSIYELLIGYRNFQEVVEEIAAEKGVTPAQLALGWVSAQGDDIVPIPGTKRLRYLEENVATPELTFTMEDRERLGVIARNVTGSRY